MKLFALATPRQRLALVAALLVALALIIADAGLIRAQDTEANVCPPGSVKYEADNGYEYGADLAAVTLAGHRAEWQALTTAGDIVQVCVKAGQSIYYPPTGPRNGAYDTPDGNDVSHVVLYLATPNAVEITDINARSGLAIDPDARISDRLLILGIVLAAILYFIGWYLSERIRHARATRRPQ